MARKSFTSDEQFSFKPELPDSHASALISHLSELNLSGSGTVADSTVTKPKDPLSVSMKPQPKTVAWYKEDLGKIPQAFLDLLPGDDGDEGKVAHIYAIRDQAWDTAPYPCIGLGLFLSLHMSQNPAYTTVLQRVKEGAKLIDVGCGFGQDIRKLVHDGAPAEGVFGLDMAPDLMGLGHDLFHDTSTSFKASFLTTDIMLEKEKAMRESAFGGAVSIAHLGAILHLFSVPEQVSLLRAVIQHFYLKPGSDALIFGYNGGFSQDEQAGEYPFGLAEGKSVWIHGFQSFKDMWKEVGKEWEVVAEVVEFTGPAGFDREGVWREMGMGIMKWRASWKGVDDNEVTKEETGEMMEVDAEKEADEC